MKTQYVVQMRFRFNNLSIFFTSCSNEVNTNEIHLSPNGNDKNTGSIDHPIAGLTRALELARELKTDKVVNIWLKNGVYRIAKPLTLTIEDSNIKWQAMPKETPVLLGSDYALGRAMGREYGLADLRVRRRR